MNTPAQDDAGQRDGVGSSRSSSWRISPSNQPYGLVGIAALALFLVLLGYYRPLLSGGLRSAPITGDAAFYAYQFARSAEVSGRWWTMGQDDRIGAPYQPEFGKHPGIFEGVDLLLVSALTGRWLTPQANYHALMGLVLVLNALVVGIAVRRLTGSWPCSALGVVLITWNYSTVFRMQGHSHLFKYGWTILATLAFSDYLDRPSVRRGIVLGLAVALVLQGSFYMGFFVGVSLGIWWLGCLASGWVGRGHSSATRAALLSCFLASASFTYPVWAVSRGSLLADAYQGHMRVDAWEHGADLWQYAVPPDSKLGLEYVADFNKRLKSPKSHFEGWHYPGLTVLSAIVVYLAFRLRGAELHGVNQRLLDRLMGLTGVLVVLSLAGGPSFFLLSGIGCFRAYGRAGLPALALWCVAAPVIFQASLARVRRAWIRPVVLVGLLAISLFEGFRATRWVPVPHMAPRQAWVDWLAKQPPDVHLAAFPPASDGLPRDWKFESLLYRVEHGHAAFNGADTLLLDSDLKLLGATYERMNPTGLRFIVSLGYDTLAFHREYLAANTWIDSLSWLHPIETYEEWSLYKVAEGLERMPSRQLAEVIRPWSKSAEFPRSVPTASWITERFDLDSDVVVGREPRHFLVWIDDHGKKIDQPVPALFQHVFGPGIPAFSVKTPRRAGEYRLAILDSHRREIASRGYRIQGDRDTGLQHLDATARGFRTTASVLERPGVGKRRIDLVVENRGSFFLQACSSRDQVYLKSMRSHPVAMRQAPGTVSLELRWIVDGEKGARSVVECPLPCDLEPGAKALVSLSGDVLAGDLLSGHIEAMPRFHERPGTSSNLEHAEIRILPGDPATERTGRATSSGGLRR